jgi:putative FmdB family regulatory protein
MSKVPIYEYRCSQCAEKFESFVRSRAAAAEIECPKCHSSKVKKVFSVFGTSGFSTARSNPDRVSVGSCDTGGG